VVYELYGLTEEGSRLWKEFMNDEGQETMNISFLRGHVSQLAQSISQFALKPGDEVIKKKGWWKFWK
jgi:uncharacterized cupin superfamily protein